MTEKHSNPEISGPDISRMTPERWRLVREKLEAALRLEGLQRSSYLAEIESQDRDLRFELDSFLASHEKGLTSFLESPAICDASINLGPPESGPMIGRRVGAYQIVEQIGAGGMGIVYRAFRADDQYHKDVAIKVIRGGQDSGFVVSRFKHERQILATLDHPHIARLLDGGSTEDGVPYFVMELIIGQPIDEYCIKLSTSAQLELFLHVCSAVQYAHQHLIIHRDIKPGNILVTPEGTPKLLDFGIAKILDPSAVENLGFTMTVFQLLTPGYASPEQIKGEPITTAADVYSLGVVLYEMLTGIHPYRVVGDTAEQLARKVCETEPKKPSSALRAKIASGSLSTPAVGTSTQALRDDKKLSKFLQGDLDNIVLMALRKEPQRRYASVEQFAEDVRRHLQNLPIHARKDTAAYRTSKFVRRHVAGLAATAVVIVALLAGLGITLVEKRRADRRFNDVRSLANSLLFEIHDSIRDLPGSTPARKLIIDRALQYLNSLSVDSGNNPTLMRELATAYERVGEVQGHYLQNNLGDTAGSLHSYQQALQLRQKLASQSRDSKDLLALARSYHMVANQQWATGDEQHGLDNTAKAIQICQDLAKQKPRDSDVLYELAFDYSLAGQIQSEEHAGLQSPTSGAAESYGKAMAVSAALLKMDPDNERIQAAYEEDLTDLGSILENQQRDLVGALEKYQQALTLAQAIRQRNATTRNVRSVAIAYNRIAGVYDSLDNSLLSMENHQNALEIYQQLIASDPQNKLLQQGLAIAYANVGTQAGVAGKKNLSFDSTDKSLNLMMGLVASSPQNVRQEGILAAIREARGDNFLRWRQFQKAQKEYEESFAIREKIDVGSKRVDSNASEVACKSKTGTAAMQAGDIRKAVAAFQQSLDLVKPLLATEEPDTTALFAAADSYAGLGNIETQQAMSLSSPAGTGAEHWKKAASWYARSLEVWEKVPTVRRKRPKSSVVVADSETVAKALRRCEAALGGGHDLPQH